MTDANTIRERFKDSVGGHLRIGSSCSTMFTTSARRRNICWAPCFNWRRKARSEFSLFPERNSACTTAHVHIRDHVRELPLKGLSWRRPKRGCPRLRRKKPPRRRSACSNRRPPACNGIVGVVRTTNAQGLASFPDEEILLRLPEQEKELLATLAVAEAPVQWEVLADGVGWNGTPPENLLRLGCC